VPGPARAVAVSGGHAHIAGNGLRIVDVNTPSSPRELVGVTETGQAESVAIAGAYAFHAGDGFHVIDVSEPANSIARPTGATDLEFNIRLEDLDAAIPRES